MNVLTLNRTTQIVPQAGELALEVDGLVKSYGKVVAVYGISFQVPKGQVVVGVNIKIHIYGHFLVHKYGKNKSPNMGKLAPQLWEDKVHNYGNENSTLLVTSPLFASWDLSFCRSLRR